ncbi:MAG TPA: transglycosylase SLT domain-containing protein [Arenibaculum sp.]|nr:transglycosylase SLT domain-containing protein [Arenibaculum sp.]
MSARKRASIEGADMLEIARLARLSFRAAGAAILALAFLVPLGSPARAAECTDFAIEAEREYDLPPGILLSIALVESGLGGIPQPYAINLDGRPVMAATFEEARPYLRDGSGRLRKNVMVGCMQIALTYHNGQFKPVDKILDPRSNVFYAARYLKRLRAETGSWSMAVARYQGGTRNQRLTYLCKIHHNLAALDSGSAALLDTAHCAQADGPPSIAPETRKKFDARQVASAGLIN